MLQLKNDIFTVSIDHEMGRFDICPNDKRFPALAGVSMGYAYQSRGQLYEYKAGSHPGKVTQQGVVETTEHGALDRVTIDFPKDEQGICFTVTLGILQEFPLVIWKASMRNTGSAAVEVDRIDLLRVKPEDSGKITYSNQRELSGLGFFSNGWQSWSPTGWYRADNRMNISKAGFLQHPMIYNPETPKPQKRGQFSSDMFAVVSDNTARTGFLVGFLAQRNHFGSIFADFNSGSLCMWANGDDARLDPGQSMETDWAVFNPVLLDHRDPLDKYLEAVARENLIRVPSETPTGWCSWYHFYTNVTAADVRNNLRSIVDMQETLPIQLVQIDDGFETRVGDWFSFQKTFPDGVAALGREITREGLTPGLWLAPFIVHPKSKLYAEHPGWILRQKNGRRVNAGIVWNSLGAALDLTIPEALEYACQVVKTAAGEWGFPYLKLDFLYAAALQGVYHDLTRTRAQVLRRGMETLREAVGPEVTLLGCGAPLGSVLGLVELMRIGADVSGDWNPKFFGVKAFISKEPAVPCARNSIRNILTRADLHQHWWINDPDCLLIRPDTNLSLAEVRSLAAAIFMTGGSLLLSDDLPKVLPERMALAAVLLPAMGERSRVIDRFEREMPEKLRLDQVNAAGEWHILTRFNWNNEAESIQITPGEFHLEAATYWVREFWTGKLGSFSEQQPFNAGMVPPHGSAVLAVRRKVEGSPAYLGSNLHISQGVELAKWEPAEKSLEFTLRLPRKTQGKVLLYIPGENPTVTINDQAVNKTEIGRCIYEILVQLDGFALARVEWK